MNHYKNLAVWAMLVSFPAAVYSLQGWKKSEVKSSDQVLTEVTPDTTDLMSIVEVKLQKVADVDVKILSAQGEVMKFKEQRQALIKDLQKVQEKIKPHLRQARK